MIKAFPSGKKLLYVWVLRSVELFVSAAENDAAFPQHDEFRVDEAHGSVLARDDDVASIVSHYVFLRQHINILQAMRHENRGHFLEISQLEDKVRELIAMLGE